MVEFAIILPLFLAFLVGIIEFSLLFFDKAVLTNAAREGARTGILYRDERVPAEEIRQRVKDYCQQYLITFREGVALRDEDIALTMTTPGGVAGAAYDQTTFASGDILTVSVTYPYTFLVLPNVMQLLPGESTVEPVIQIRARTSMQGE